MLRPSCVPYLSPDGRGDSQTAVGRDTPLDRPYRQHMSEQRRIYEGVPLSLFLFLGASVRRRRSLPFPPHWPPSHGVTRDDPAVWYVGAGQVRESETRLGGPGIMEQACHSPYSPDGRNELHKVETYFRSPVVAPRMGKGRIACRDGCRSPASCRIASPSLSLSLSRSWGSLACRGGSKTCRMAQLQTRARRRP